MVATVVVVRIGRVRAKGRTNGIEMVKCKSFARTNALCEGCQVAVGSGCPP